MSAPSPVPDTLAPSPVPTSWVLTPGLTPGEVLSHRRAGRGAACALCGEKITRRSSPIGPVPCQLCGAVFHEACYWSVASFGEHVTLECSDTPYLFVCRPCRS